MNSQKKITKKGGTMRLGAYKAKIKPGTETAKAYKNKNIISRRHRHRYEYNNSYRKAFKNAGMTLAGTSPDKSLVEIIEYSKNDFFIGCQFHPEFSSRPDKPEGLYLDFIKHALKVSEKKEINNENIRSME